MGTTKNKSLNVRQNKDSGLFTNELTDKQANTLLKQAVTDHKKFLNPSNND